MKKLLYILLFLPLIAQAQIPVHDTSFYGAPTRGMMTYSPTLNKLFYRSNVKWELVTNGVPLTYTNGYGLGLLGNIFYADTTELATQYDLTTVVGSPGPTGPTGATGPAGSTTLAGLTDVSLSGLASGDLLKYNGSLWQNFVPNYLTSVPTFQQTLTAGSTLSANNYVNGTGYHFGMYGMDSFYVSTYGNEVSIRLDTTRKTAEYQGHVMSFGDKNGSGNGTVINLTDSSRTVVVYAQKFGLAGLNTYTTGTVQGLLRATFDGNITRVSQYPYSLLGTGTGPVLTYNAGTPAWANTDTSMMTGLHNYFLQKVDTGRTLTINGTAQSLSADRTWSVGTVTSIGTTAPITGGTITGTGTIGISQATTSTDGYLNSTDWNTFNNKVPTSRTLTINGTAQDLSANRTWNVGTVTSITGGTGVTSGAITTSGTLNASNVTYKIANVNLKNTGNTTIVTTSSGQGRFVPMIIVIHITALAGAGSPASVSVGQTSAAYTDMMANTSLTGLTAANLRQQFAVINPSSSVPASTAIVFKVNTAATYATSCTADVYIWGWYESY